MAPWSHASGKSTQIRSAAQPRLLERALRGSRSAVEALFAWQAPLLRDWARGRLPRWVRGVIDTSDVVQDALHHTFARFLLLEPKHVGAFRAYLRQAVENRIRDELRRAVSRPDPRVLQVRILASEDDAPQHQQLLDEEAWRRYLAGLERLTARERRLIVGRGELGYTFKQLALVEGQSSPDAARMALRRALIRLSRVMPDA